MKHLLDPKKSKLELENIGKIVKKKKKQSRGAPMSCSAQRKVHILSASLANQNEVHPKLEFKKDSEIEEINRQG